MRTFAHRRFMNVTLALGSSILLVLMFWVLTATLLNTIFYTGFTLTGLVLFLALYNLRKKLPFLPLGSSSTWLQIHIYAGLISILVFLMHVRFSLPNGYLEGILAALFALTALSGVFGLIVSRLFAKRLSHGIEEVIYERIPMYRHRLQDEVGELALQSVRESNATTISDFCSIHLIPYLDRPRSFWTHVFGLRRGNHPLVEQAQSLNRYLKDSEETVLNQIIIRIRVKDDLDFQHSLQTVLKLWLFIHIPLTYGLLLFMVAHIALVLAFTGN